MKHSIQSLKFIYSLARFSPENYPQVQIKNDTYVGLDSSPIPLKILTRFNKTDKNTVIMFPGASPDGENHEGMLFLGSIICRLGFKVLIPRIPPLKELKINMESFNWFSHAYSEILKRDDIFKDKIISIGLSFGGALLLGASFDKRISDNPPKSIMTFGTYYDIESTLKFLCSGKLKIDNKNYFIKPHSWGLTVLFHNFLDKLNFSEFNGYESEIRKIIALKIKEDDDNLEIEINKLPDSPRLFIQKIFDCEIDAITEQKIYEVLNKEKDFVNQMSPKHWYDKIKNKVFIMHGSNDSMVPFTESIELNKKIKNSSLFVSYMYEHKEISTDKGLLFKIKEFYKMYKFFKGYFKYNEG